MNVRTVGLAATVAATNFFRPSLARSIIGSILQWRWLFTPRPLHTVSMGQLRETPLEIKMYLCPQAHGDTPPDDLLALCLLVNLQQPRTLFEFGTFRGQSTINMIMNAAPGAHIHTLDAPPQKRASLDEWDSQVHDDCIGELFQGSPYAAQITQILEDSRTLDTRDFRGSMDLIYIDAGHDYPFVRNDSEKAFEMLATDGMIVWHDYSPVKPGVRRYLQELANRRLLYWIANTQIAFYFNTETPPISDPEILQRHTQLLQTLH